MKSKFAAQRKHDRMMRLLSGTGIIFRKRLDRIFAADTERCADCGSRIIRKTCDACADMYDRTPLCAKCAAEHDNLCGNCYLSLVTDQGYSSRAEYERDTNIFWGA